MHFPASNKPTASPLPELTAVICCILPPVYWTQQQEEGPDSNPESCRMARRRPALHQRPNPNPNPNPNPEDLAKA